MTDPSTSDPKYRQRVTVTLIAIAVVMILAMLLGVLVVLNADRIYREESAPPLRPPAVVLSINPWDGIA